MQPMKSYDIRKRWLSTREALARSRLASNARYARTTPSTKGTKDEHTAAIPPNKLSGAKANVHYAMPFISMKY